MSALLDPHVGPECQCVPGATAHGIQMMGYLVAIACVPSAPSCRPLRCSESARAPQMIETCCLDAKEVPDFIIQYSVNPNIFFCSSVGQSERLLTVRSQVRALPGERHFLTSHHSFLFYSLTKSAFQQCTCICSLLLHDDQAKLFLLTGLNYLEAISMRNLGLIRDLTRKSV
jgi:hypothetical protein